MDLNQLDVVALANNGTVLELLHPSTGEVLTDRGEEYKSEVSVINSDNKLDSKQKEKAIEKLQKPKPFFIRLLGSDCDVYRNEMKRRFEKSQNKTNKNKVQKIDLDDAQRKGAELLAKCTTDCYMIEDGKPVECTRPEMVRLYLKLPWLREQAEDHMSDRSNLTTS